MLLGHTSIIMCAGSVFRPPLSSFLRLFAFIPCSSRTVVTEAQQQKDLLIRHGLVERVLQSLVESLDEFDRVAEQGSEGRRVHIGARVELDVVADEVVQIVRVVDGLNRFRFAGEPDLMAAWKSASNAVGPPKPAEKDASEIKPAA